MKIKWGFITNSSSTVYIVFIPDDFSLDRFYTSRLLETELDELLLHGHLDDATVLTQEEKEEAVSSITESIESFKEGEQYSYDTYNVVTIGEWKVLLKICEDNNFIISSVELPMSNNDALIGIAQETIIKTLTNHINLDEFMKPFIREVNDDTKNTNKS